MVITGTSGASSSPDEERGRDEMQAPVTGMRSAGFGILFDGPVQRVYSMSFGSFLVAYPCMYSSGVVYHRDSFTTSQPLNSMFSCRSDSLMVDGWVFECRSWKASRHL